MATATNYHNLRLPNGRFAPKGTKTTTKKASPKKKVDNKGKEIWEMFCLDRSGSMESIRTETINGFNSVLKSIQEVAKDTKIPSFCSLLQFDDPGQEEVVYLAKEAENCKNLDRSTFVPRGWTALHDAVGKAIELVREQLGSKLGNKDVQVTITVMSDGNENMSKKYSSQSIKNLIEEMRDKYNWTINFIGAGNKEEVTRTAEKMGIFATNSLNYTADSIGTTTAFASYSNARTAKSKLFVEKGENNNFGFFSND